MKNESKLPDTDQINRRSFVTSISALGATGFVALNLPTFNPAVSTGDIGSAAIQTPSASPSPSPTPAPPSPLAEAYAEVAKVRFGKNVEAGQWDRIKRDLEGNVRAADRLREAKLKNADEPDFVFKA
jgi:hypothetical protein